ncbi:MAG TPA: hypothetical protein PKL60_04900 [Anaerolineaceae bacterium]|nr:hypothetical protein [Anaerolineaceae bacterium]
MMNSTKIELNEAAFSEKEKQFLQNEAFTAVLFRYSTQVCAVRLSNSKINLVVLPFQGQQVWRFASPIGNMTMKSIFDEPENTTRFGLNYGAFLIHCGLTANGNPSAEDSHPLHGELPNCHYQEAYLRVGTDEKGDFLALGGSYVYRNSLEYHYEFAPELRMRPDSALVDVHIQARNFRPKAMKYMYMAHINWLPVDCSRLVASANPKATEVFSDTFGLPNSDQQKFMDYIERLGADPTIADKIDSSSQIYDPEVCMYLHYSADEQGYAHAMQVFPGGDAAYVAFRTKELPNAVRWFARTGSEDALAFAIPSTNNHLGFARNDAKGLIREIGAKDCLEMHYRFGYLSCDERRDVETKIDKVLGKA